ncbi:MAG: hypothetical protein AAGC55_19700 [Myxococcota bacterium]
MGRQGAHTVMRIVRLAGLLGLALTLVACLDVRDFAGAWSGPRVGESAQLRQGIADDASASLTIEQADLTGLRGRVTISDLIADAAITPIPGAEADVLASATFDGGPARVFMAFVPTDDGGGDALMVIALFDSDRIEVRVMRGGTTPLYGIFALSPDP